MREHRHRLIAFYGIAALVWVLDRLTKWATLRQVGFGGSSDLLGGLLSVTPVRNTNAAWSIPVPTAILILVSAAVAVWLLLCGTRAAGRSISLMMGLSLLLGGATGNLYDRLRWGYVIDFLDLHFWPTFNVADSAITAGALLVACFLIAHRHGDKPDDQDETTQGCDEVERN